MDGTDTLIRPDTSSASRFSIYEARRRSSRHKRRGLDLLESGFTAAVEGLVLCGFREIKTLPSFSSRLRGSPRLHLSFSPSLHCSNGRRNSQGSSRPPLHAARRIRLISDPKTSLGEFAFSPSSRWCFSFVLRWPGSLKCRTPASSALLRPWCHRPGHCSWPAPFLFPQLLILAINLEINGSYSIIPLRPTSFLKSPCPF